MTPALDVTVNVEHGDAEPEPLRRAARHVLRAEGRDAGALSVTLLSDDAMRALNRSYLGRDRTTDVIAFSLGEGGDLLGDVYVGVDQARRQAAELDLDPTEELMRLVVHGTLHVLGHDHPEGPERDESPMYRRQEALLAELRAD